ncbi:MAG: hypothetical protein AAF770_03555 [Bacteroidota bacterium]
MFSQIITTKRRKLLWYLISFFTIFHWHLIHTAQSILASNSQSSDLNISGRIMQKGSYVSMQSQEGHTVYFDQSINHPIVTQAIISNPVSSQKGSSRVSYAILKIRCDKEYAYCSLEDLLKKDIPIFIYPRRGRPQYLWISDNNLSGGGVAWWSILMISFYSSGVCLFGCLIESGKLMMYKDLLKLHHTCQYRNRSCDVVHCCFRWGLLAPILYPFSLFYNCLLAWRCKDRLVKPCEDEYQERIQASELSSEIEIAMAKEEEENEAKEEKREPAIELKVGNPSLGV